MLAALYFDFLCARLNESVSSVICGEVRSGHTHRLVLPSYVSVGVIFALAPKLVEFLEEVVFLDGSRRIRPSNTYNPWSWRWIKSKVGLERVPAKVIDKEEVFYSGSVSTCHEELQSVSCSMS